MSKPAAKREAVVGRASASSESADNRAGRKSSRDEKEEAMAALRFLVAASIARLSGEATGHRQQ